ncbi:MAG TPA: PAS domain S-box protein [Stenomitos sp.]
MRASPIPPSRGDTPAALMQALWEASPDAWILTDRDDVITAWNPAAEHLFGHAAVSVLGHPLSDLGLGGRMPGGDRSEYEVDLEDGRTVHVAMRSLLDGAGTPVGFARFCRDVSSVKGMQRLVVQAQGELGAASQLLNEAEAKYLAVVGQIPAITFLGVYDDTQNVFKLQYVSPQVEALLGFDQAEWLRDPTLWLQQVHPDDRGQFQRDWRQARERRQAESSVHEYRMQSRSGRTVWLHASLSIVFDRSGMPLYFQGVAFDITHRKEEERILSHFAAIVTGSNDAIISVDLTGRVMSWNPAATTLYGYTAQEAVGQSVRFLYPADRHEEHVQLLARLARGEHICHYDTVRLHKSGERIDVWLSIAPIYDAKGNVIGSSYIVHDATEQRQLERLKAQFFANMSHELRTPLNAIIGFSENALDGLAGPLDRQPTHYFENILAAGKHLLTLINDVLDLAKLQNDKDRLYLEEFPITAAFDRVQAMFEPILAAKSQPMAVVVNPDLPPVHGDPEKVFRILTNLVSNASKFSPEGGRITLRARQSGAMLRIDVSDEGIGIPAEALPSIFEEFRQVDLMRKPHHQGSGLGLTIVKHLVEMHRGHLSVESVLNRGSVFTFTLPLAKEPT